LVLPEAETTALLARFTTPADSARAHAINEFIKALKAADAWDDIDVLHVMAAADSQAALLNWKSTSFTASLVNAPSFTADRGFTGDAATSYVDSGFTPSTAGGEATLNSFCFSIYVLNNVVGGGASGVSDGTNQTNINPRNGSGQRIGRANQGGTTTGVASTDSRGLTTINRSGAANLQLYLDGTQVATSTTASTALPSAPIRYGSSGAAAFNGFQHAIARIASSQSQAKETAFHNAAFAYLQAVGAA